MKVNRLRELYKERDFNSVSENVLILLPRLKISDRALMEKMSIRLAYLRNRDAIYHRPARIIACIDSCIF